VSGISDDLQQCYLAGTFKDSDLAGTVHVTFTIEPTGRVSSAVDSGSDMADQDVVACVVDLFAGLSFRPGGQNPTEVTYPITFHRRG
jgi:TonB family protein